MWLLASLAASILWGLSYAVSERALKWGYSPASFMTVYAGLSLPIYGFLAWKYSNVTREIENLREHPGQFATIIFVVLCYLVANLLVFWSIQQKNATTIGLIEIAYPVFTAFFAWALYRDLQLNMGVIVGAIMIMCGVTCVAYYTK